MIAQQAIKAASQPNTCVVIMSDDTVVLVLILYFYDHQSLTSNVFMKSPVKGRKVIDIKSTYAKFKAIIPDLSKVHALTGCDTVASYFGIGKATAMKVAYQHRLDLLGVEETSIEHVVVKLLFSLQDAME